MESSFKLFRYDYENIILSEKLIICQNDKQ